MDKSQKCTYNTFKYLAIAAHCLALLPVSVEKKSFQFKWKSFCAFYSLLLTFLLSALLVFELIHLANRGVAEVQFNSLVMKVYSILVLILNIRLASLWPNIIKSWSQIDLVMDRRYGRLKNLNLRIKVWLALYFVSTLAGYVDSFVVTGITDILQFNFYSFIFNYIVPNYILAVIYLFVYTVHFFVINFNDIFIILTSMAVALRFQQIGNRLEMNEKSKSHTGMVDFWLEMRHDYDRLSHLCKSLDDAISGLILVSFAYNMFFIITYLFHHLTVENDGSQIIIFYWFFSYLVLRVFAVCLYTSWINDESLTPVPVLNSVVSRDYNSEIGRWLVQMSFDDVALTGGKIFKITRSIFLSVVSIVVTYELVVMQFYGFSTKIESGR